MALFPGSPRNNQLPIRYPDGRKATTVLATLAEVEAALAQEFGLPRLPVREAVATLAALGVDIFAGK